MQKFYYLCNMEQRLRNKIEKVVGRLLKTPRDFKGLSELITERIHEPISGSTLRRFWGYVNEGVKASLYTKDVLARYLGYLGFSDFIKAQGENEVQSQLVMGENVVCEDLYIGQMLRLSWLPNRTCVVRYNGYAQFTVVESENTQLTKGDTFECHLFILHEPAYLNNWLHQNQPAVTYVIGKKNGIIVERYLED